MVRPQRPTRRAPEESTPHRPDQTLLRNRRPFGPLSAPRGDVDEMANLATVGPNSRFNTLRPAPSRLMDHARDLDTTQVHDLDLALVK